MQERTAIVSGSTGCVGHAVVDALLSDPLCVWTIYVPLRDTRQTEKIKDFLHLVSVLDWRWPWPQVDAVFHCAGNTSYHASDMEALWQDNVELTDTVLSRLGDAKLIFTSTAATWAYRPWGCEFNPKNPYAYTKAAAEWIVKMNVNNHVILQPCIVVGEHDYNNYAKLFELATKGELFGAFAGGIEFGYVKDIAKAHVEAYWNGREGEYYILGGVKATWKEFFTLICEAVGKPKKVKVIPTWLLKLYCRWLALWSKKPMVTQPLVDMLAVDANVPAAEALKSQRELRYHPTVNLSEMVNKAYQWWRKHHV